MNLLKKNPIFFAILLVALLVFGAGVYLVQGERASVAGIKQQVEREKASLRQVNAGVVVDPAAGISAFPSRENLALLEERRKQVEEDFESMKETLRARSDSLFDENATEFNFLPRLQGYISRFTSMAATQGVRLTQGEAFGFSRYARQADNPPAASIPMLDRQRQILDFILTKLFAAEPMAIESVRREGLELRALSESERRAARQAAPDLFEVSPLVSAGTHQYVDTLGFEVTFVGSTETLRVFLNELAQFEMPLLVRSIGVEPFTASARAASRAAPRGGAPAARSQAAPDEDDAIPVIKDNDSRFRVLIEFFEVSMDGKENRA